MLSTYQLRSAMPYAGDMVEAFVEPLGLAMVAFEISSPRRQAAFLANVAAETASLHELTEKSDGSEYQGRMGNTEPGDGALFIGRGCLQITGRYEYETAGKALGVDFVSQPQLVATPKWAASTGAWFWRSKGLNDLADRDAFGTIVHLINGGFNGLDERIQCWLTARKALGL